MIELTIALSILSVVWGAGYLLYLANRRVKLNIIEVEE